MIKKDYFHNYLRDKRIRLGLTQTEVARRVKVASSTISHIEAGDLTRFPLEKVLELAAILQQDKEAFSQMWISAILEKQQALLNQKIYKDDSDKT